MRICGISIDSNKVNIVVIDDNEEKEYTLIDTGILKIALENEAEQNNIKNFSRTLQNFVNNNKIEIIGIKKRLHSGKFAGGAISFKIEATIQLLKNVDVILLPAKTIASKTKNTDIDKSLFKYQHEAFKTAYATLQNICM